MRKANLTRPHGGRVFAFRDAGRSTLGEFGSFPPGLIRHPSPIWPRRNGADFACPKITPPAEYRRATGGIIPIFRRRPMKATLYEALGIQPGSSDEEVRAALRR